MATRSLNKVMLIGNLTRDPELKYIPSGSAVCTFSIATNRSWTGNDGQIKEEAQFHRVVAWQKLAELCAKFLAKGRRVYIEGRLTHRNYTASDGQQRTVTEIVAEDFLMLDGNRSNARNPDSSDDVQAPNQRDEAPGPQQESAPDDDKINIDDIPF